MSETNAVGSLSSPSDASCISEEEKQKILQRKCPSCANAIRRYFFTCLFLPLEYEAMRRVEVYSKINSFTFLPISKTYAFSQYMMHLSSTCENCGLVSTWSCDHAGITFIKSEEGVNNGLMLSWIYSPKMWETFREQVTNERVLEEIEEVTKMISVVYEGWGEK